MKPSTDNLEQAAVAQQCRALRLPAVADQCASLAEEAIKQRLTYLRYLEALLATELEERERNTIARRIKDAHLPRMKTLEEFDFSKAPQIQATKIHELAQCGYIERAEPVILIGDCGTGKTHLLTGLCVAACRQKREFASLPPPLWSTNWSRRSSNCSCVVCWPDGNATT
jgi:DNA replication protein DnaC